VKVRATILSYWTFPTDLAACMSGWSEFAGGDGYSVDLRSDTGDEVAIRLVDGQDGKWAEISATSTGILFERALGRATIEMAKNSEIHVWADDKDA